MKILITQLFLLLVFQSTGQTFNIVNFRVHQNDIVLQYEAGLVGILDKTSGEVRLADRFRDENTVAIANTKPLLVSNYKKYNGSAEYSYLAIRDYKTNQLTVLDSSDNEYLFRECHFNSSETHLICNSMVYEIKSRKSQEIATPEYFGEGRPLILDFRPDKNEILLSNIDMFSNGKSALMNYPEMTVKKELGTKLYQHDLRGDWYFFNHGMQNGPPNVQNLKSGKKIAHKEKFQPEFAQVSPDGSFAIYQKSGLFYLWNTTLNQITPFPINEIKALQVDPVNPLLYYFKNGEIVQYDPVKKISLKKWKPDIPVNYADQLPCKYSMVQKQQFSAKGSPFSSSTENEVQWPNLENGRVAMETHYEDLNYDGFQDVIIDHVGTAYVDFLFGNGKGGFTGYQRISFDTYYREFRFSPGKIVVTGTSETWYDELLLDRKGEKFTVYKRKSNPGGNNTNPFCLYYVRDQRIDTLVLGNYVMNGKPIDNYRLPKQSWFDLNLDGQQDSILEYRTYLAPRPEGKIMQEHPDDKWAVELFIGGKSKKFDVPYRPFTIETGDFNADGWMDFAVGSPNSKTLNFFFNQGKGLEFEQKTFDAPEPDIYHFEIWDFDGDGACELSLKYGTNLYLIGCDNSKTIRIKQHIKQIKNTDYSHKTVTDLNLDGALDYVALSHSGSGSSRRLQLNTYLGQVQSGQFALVGAKDFSGDPIEVRVERRATTESHHHGPAEKGKQLVVCPKCVGKGKIWVSGTSGCQFCGGGGSSSGCGWCGGSGQLHTEYRRNGHIESNSRSCPKCAGGMRGGSVSCYACKGKPVAYSGYEECDMCRGWRYMYYQED